MEESTHFSTDNIELSLLTENEMKSLISFYCGVKEIDDFFHTEVGLCAKYHYLIPYKCKNTATNEIIGLFTLANDTIVLEESDKIEFPNINPEYNWIFKRQSSYPAINIGHLAIREDCQSKGVGSLIVNFVAESFAINPISGCQFLTVDALNNLKTINFYQLKLGFEFQTVYDLNHPTRRMYLDIFT